MYITCVYTVHIGIVSIQLDLIGVLIYTKIILKKGKEEREKII